jgi:hypothetical protein
MEEVAFSPVEGGQHGKLAEPKKQWFLTTLFCCCNRRKDQWSRVPSHSPIGDGSGRFRAPPPTCRYSTLQHHQDSLPQLAACLTRRHRSRTTSSRPFSVSPNATARQRWLAAPALAGCWALSLAPRGPGCLCFCSLQISCCQSLLAPLPWLRPHGYAALLAFAGRLLSGFSGRDLKTKDCTILLLIL